MKNDSYTQLLAILEFDRQRTFDDDERLIMMIMKFDKRERPLCTINNIEERSYTQLLAILKFHDRRLPSVPPNQSRFRDLELVVDASTSVHVAGILLVNLPSGSRWDFLSFGMMRVPFRALLISFKYFRIMVVDEFKWGPLI